jgi:hypothetical protein
MRTSLHDVMRSFSCCCFELRIEIRIHVVTQRIENEECGVDYGGCERFTFLLPSTCSRRKRHLEVIVHFIQMLLAPAVISLTAVWLRQIHRP